jgi:hypothetical protein
VRLMISYGVTYPIVSSLLKSLFVEVANQDFRIGDLEPTDSRISLITGVHRKDVRRLSQEKRSSENDVPEAVSFGGKLIATWLSDKRYLDRQGRARALPRTRVPKGDASFEELVERRSTDIRPRAVLDEWLRLGLVHIDDLDHVVLNSEAFIPKAGLDEKLYFFAHNLHDHAAAATENLLSEPSPYLERSVLYDKLSDASITILDKRARLLGSRMLKELNRLAMEREAIDAENSSAQRRFTCGVYFYAEPTEVVGE